MTVTASRIFAVALLAAGVVLACTDDPTGPGSGYEPWLLQPVYPSNPDQPLTGVVGAPLDSLLRFRVVDREGRFVSRAEVVFVVLDTAQVGAFEPAKANSDGNGIVSTKWILGTKAEVLQQAAALLEVRDSSGEVITREIKFSAIGKADSPVKIEIVSGDGQIAPTNDTLGVALAVRVSDRFNNPVSDVEVIWQSDGDGVAIPARSATDADGIASTRVITGSEPRTQITTAQVEGLGEVRFTSTVVARSDLQPVAIDIEGWPASVSARVGTMSPVAPAVRVTDPHGYPVQGVRVDWTIEAGQGELRQPYSFTNSSGIATNLWRLGTQAGVQVLRASILGGSKSVTLSAEALPDEPAQLRIISGDAQQGSVTETLAEPFLVRVEDVHGNPVPGTVVRWTVTSGSGKLSRSLSATDVDGHATSTLALGTEAGEVTVEARLDEVGSVSPVVFKTFANPGPVAELVRVSGDGQLGFEGDTLAESLVVQVLDAHGNAIPEVPLSWRVGAGTGTILQADTLSDEDGFARASFQAGPEREQLVEVATDTFVTSFQVWSIIPALTLVSGDGQTGRVNEELAKAFVVKVTDAQTNHPVAGARVTWIVGQGGGSISPEESVTDEEGLASATRTLGTKVGVHTAMATFGTLSVEFQATATGSKGEARLEKVSGDDQTGVAGQALSVPYVVRVLDQSGVPVSGVTVRWSVRPGDGGVISTSTAESDDQGLARVTAILPNTVGATQRVIARVDALADSVVFVSTAVVSDEPMKLVQVSGNDQAGVAGRPLSAPLMVRVTSESGKPVSGITVHWAVGQGGGTVTWSTSVTSGDGTAFVQRTLGDSIGTQTTIASVPGFAGSPVVFTHQAAAPFTPYYLEKAPSDNGDNQTAVVGQPLAKPLRVIVLNADRAPISGVTVTWRAESGGGFVGGPGFNLATSMTDASGIATMARTLGNAPGIHTTVAEVQGLIGSPVTFTSQAEAARSPAYIEVLAITDEQRGIRNQLLMDSIRVIVLDDARVPMAEIPVRWRVIEGGGSVGSLLTTTNGDGIASNTFRLGGLTGRAHAVEVSVDGLAVRDTLWASATLDPSLFVIHEGDQQEIESEGVLAPLKVLVLDAQSEPVRGAAVIWHIAGGGGEISGSPEGTFTTMPVITYTDVNGIATAWRKAPVPSPLGNYPVLTLATLRDYSAVSSVTFTATWK